MTEIDRPSDKLQSVLDYIEDVKERYEAASEAMKLEDKRLQDLLHELEFAEDKAERNKVATKFQRSRRERRKQKDITQELELLVEFFGSANHKNTINKIRPLLEKQKKREEYLDGERYYKKRVEE